jgi:hypothetical protein
MKLRHLLPLVSALAFLAASCAGHSPAAPSERGATLALNPPPVVGCPAAGSPSDTIPLASAQTAYGCYQWWPYQPTSVETLVDIITSADDDQGLGPSAFSVAGLEAVGARITYRFHVAMVRAIVDPLRAAPLVSTASSHPVAYRLKTVANRCAYDAQVYVLLTRQVMLSDLAIARSIGATIGTNVGREFYDATIDDARIPFLRSLPAVKRVIVVVPWGGMCD